MTFNSCLRRNVGIGMLSSILTIISFIQLWMYEYHRMALQPQDTTLQQKFILPLPPSNTTNSGSGTNLQRLSLIRHEEPVIVPRNSFPEIVDTTTTSTVPFFPRISRRNPLPPLESLITSSSATETHSSRDSPKNLIIGNVSDLLDFAIIGFAKAGTSTMMEYLNQPPISLVFQEEHCHIGYDKPAVLVPKLYHALWKAQPTNASNTASTLIGIKCPRNIDDSMINFSTYFPQTKFVIALRHPVHWFQSMYNFRIHNEGVPLPHPNLLQKGHITGAKGVFANRVRYHHMLGRLGKTPLTEERELALVFHNATNMDKQIFYDNLLLNTGNKLFVYHVEQLPPSTAGTLPQSLVTDISHFLGLETNLQLRPTIRRWIPGKKFTSQQLKQREALKINICKEEYRPLRDVLVQNGKISAQWIREFFVRSPDVAIPSGKSFYSLLDQWSIDPCGSSEK